MVALLTGLGFSSFDIVLIVICPIGGLIGSLAHAIHLSINPINPPSEEGKNYIASKELQEARGIWLSLRLMLGAILGFVIGLYFVGTIQESASTITKIMALAIVAGYAAPKIWLAQEEVIIKQLGSKSE